MRLTLRTLLAYLDDILPPAQAKEIGQKINESNYASTLVDRIRDVMRRRRLTAPELDSDVSSFDANTVAEYLDNTLQPDTVAEVEKVCLESDIHLAEVAACHQILTLVLGEPVEIRQKSRERMYALAPWGKPEFAATAGAGASAEPAAAPIPAKTANRETAPAGIPEYMKSEPIWRRARMPILFLTCVGLWLVLLWVDPTYNPLHSLLPEEQQQTVADSSGSRPVAPLAAGENAGDAAPETGVAQPDATPSETNLAPSDATDVSVADTTAPIDDSIDETPIDPPPPADEPEDELMPVAEAESPTADEMPAEGTPSDATPDEAPPTDVAVIASRTPDSAPEAADAAAPTENAQPAAPPREPAKIQYNSQSGVTLRWDQNVGDWVVLPLRSLVHPGDQLACPEPFEAALDVGTEACRVTLLGGTAATSLAPTSTVSFGFDVKRGRVVIEGRSAAAGAGPVVLAVAIGKTLWHLEIVSPETRCGLEVLPRVPNQFEQDLAGDAVRANLYVLSGAVRVADETELRAVIDGPSRLSLVPASGSEGALEVLPLPAKLNWLQPQAAPVSRTNVRYASLFEREFEFDKAISLFVPALVKSTNPRLSQYATECMALTENINALVSALVPAAHEESRRAAIAGLRTWLPRAPENRDVLRTELARVLTGDDAGVVYRLLWGYNLDDARNLETSTQLVDWLDHEHIAVRELAFVHILELTGGRRYDYRPLAPQAQRKAAIGRWREHLDREGALIK